MLKSQGQPDMILPLESVLAVVPLLPPAGRDPALPELLKGYQELQESRQRYACAENSDNTLQQWGQLVREKKKAIQEQSNQLSAEQNRQLQQAVLLALQKDEEAKKLAQKKLEEEKTRQIDLAKEKVVNYQRFRTRKEIEEATQFCERLDKSDLAKIQDHGKASEYWNRCLTLPADVEMPGNLEDQKEPSIDLTIDPSASGSALTAFAWALFFLSLIGTLHGLDRFLGLLQERSWVGACFWFGISSVAGTCFFLLFFSGRGNAVEAESGDSLETRALWAALINVKNKEVTRFPEKIEIPSRIFLQQIIRNMKNPETGSTAWVPRLTRLPAVGWGSGIELGVEVPMKWISLPVRVSFADPLPGQEISLTATGGKIGPFYVGERGGAWIWGQIAPAYQGVVTGIGLDQGVKLSLLNSEKVVVSIPEIRARVQSR